MGYMSTQAGVIYTCPHTGEQFMGKDLATAQALARQLSPDCEGALESGNVSVLTGNPSDQVGSQAWMDAQPPGVQVAEPTYAEKARLSDATYAASWLGVAVNNLANTEPNVKLNPALGIIQSYPVSGDAAQIWKAVPALAPPSDILVNTPSNSYGSEAEPAYVQGTTGDTGTSVGTQDSTTALGKIAGAASSIPLWIIGGLAILVFAIFIFGGSAVGRRARA